jgi:hypothetical protein
MMEYSGLPDLKVQYSEGCTALRHYSLCVFNVRVVTIAQGLILLAGAAALWQKDSFTSAMVASLFGVFFSAALWALQRSYWMCFNAILSAVLILERSASTSTSLTGPWASYEGQSKVAFGKLWWRILVKNGPYWLFALSFVVIFILALRANG